MKSEPQVTKVRALKVERMRQIKSAYDLARKNGQVTVSIIKPA